MKASEFMFSSIRMMAVFLYALVVMLTTEKTYVKVMSVAMMIMAVVTQIGNLVVYFSRISDSN